MIYPHGLLDGERLAACTDEAKLHFPRLAAIANGYGRFKLSEKEILDKAYEAFRVKPTRDELISWISEYCEQYLLLVFTADDGSQWGQWCGVPDNALPRYRTSADMRSPAPSPECILAFNEAYAIKKRERCKASGDLLNISESFGKFLEVSDSLRTFPRVVVGGVVGGEKLYAPATQTPLLKDVTAKAKESSAKTKTPSECERVWEAFPLKKGKGKAIPVICKILADLRKQGHDNPGELLVERIRCFEANRTKKRAAGEFVPEIPYPQKWFSRGDWNDPDSIPKPKVVFDEVSPEIWHGNGGGPSNG